MNSTFRAVACTALLLTSLGAAGSAPAFATGATSAAYELSFADFRGGDPIDWLKGKQFVFERDARRSDLFGVSTAGPALALEAHKPVHAILLNQAVKVSDFSGVEIEWGVQAYPQGASYEREINSEAIMVIFFLGETKKPSGSAFAPDAPAFIGLFLCDGDNKLNHPYIGHYYREGGRYVCVDKPQPGRTVVSRFNLLGAYQKYFGADAEPDPEITGLAISVDTSALDGEEGRSSAFIRKVRILR